MSTATQLSLTLLLAFMTSVPLLQAEEGKEASAQSAVPAGTYEGTYKWNGLGKRFNLVCTVDAEGKAAFVAKFRDKKDHKYQGTFKAGEKAGEVIGTVPHKKNKVYIVRGIIKGKEFTADFFTTGKDGKEAKNGSYTMTLSDS